MTTAWWNAAFVAICIWTAFSTFKHNTAIRALVLIPIRWIIIGVIWWLITFAAGIFEFAAEVHEQRQQDKAISLTHTNDSGPDRLQDLR